MSGTRGVDVPFEHLTAELAAAPLASEAACRLSITELDPTLRRGGGTDTLWRTTEVALVSAFPSFSVDEVTALRDWLWFRESDTDTPVPLADYLREVAASTLVFSGNVFRPSMPPWANEMSHAPAGSDDARARRFWRWVSFALPPDLLMAAHPAQGNVASEIELVSPILTRTLQDQGYVEPHMHIGAALDFPLLWISVLHALARPEELDAESFHSPGAEAEEGRNLAAWLIRAAIARYPG